MMGHLIAIVQTTEYFEDKSILIFLQCQSITISRGISSSNKVHFIYPCFMLIMLGNYDHFAFWLIA